MKKIIASLLLVAGLQLTASAPMIINRTGQSISVNFIGASGALFSTGAIALAGDAAHTTDKMVLIPSTSVMKPGTSVAYPANATSATITVASGAVVTISSFAANTSYVIAPATGSTTVFVANPGLITYNTTSGAGSTSANPPVVGGAGF